MNKVPEIIKQSQLLRRLVFNKNTVESQGRVQKLWLNSQGSQIIGVTCNLELFGDKKQYLSWEEIDTIGADAILANIGPDRQTLEEPKNEVVALGTEIWTDAGNKVGFLADYLFNTRTGAVVNLLYRRRGFLGRSEGLYLLSPESISSAGNNRVIVAEEAVQTSELYAPGLGQKLSQARAYLKGDLQKTKEHIKLVRRDSQGWAENFQGKAQQVKEQAQQKAGEIKEKAQTLAAEAQQKAGEIKEKVREPHQELKEDSQSDGNEENTAETSNQFQNQITEVTQKAKEMIGGIKSGQDSASVAVPNEEELKTDGENTDEAVAVKIEEQKIDGENTDEAVAVKIEEQKTDGENTDEAVAVKIEEQKTDGESTDEAVVVKIEEQKTDGENTDEAVVVKIEEQKTDANNTDEATPENQPKDL